MLEVRAAGDGAPPLSAGKHTISFGFKYDGPGIAKGGTGELRADGQMVRTMQIPKTIPFLLPPDETFDIGDDTRTGVNDLDYTVPFPLNARLNKLTFELGPSELKEAERSIVRGQLAKAHD